VRTLAGCGALALAVISAPAAGPAAPIVVPDAEWRASAPGLERAVVEVPGSPARWRTHVVAVRIDPARFRFRLRARLGSAGPSWSVDKAPIDAVLALNAGQFSGIVPWGWVVMDGEEIRPPGTGPLSTAIAWDAGGRARWLSQDQIEPERAAGGVVEAIQSYPTLLDERGEIPRQIHEAGLGVDVRHRDGRLAIGALRDGRLLVALTRFYGFGEVSPALPLGLTLEEMASVMRALGCRRAVSLDGGISAQLLLREGGRTMIWRGWRPVPLGLVAEPMPAPAGTGKGE
jgi:exopolysaccharide biosynthesis protein